MRYLLIVSLKYDAHEPDRAKSHLAAFVELVQAVSSKDCTPAFHSRDYLTFGYYFRTLENASSLGARFTGLAAFRSEDALTILEVGDLVAFSGMSTAATWLQRHP